MHRALARLDFELQLQLVQRRSEREYELATDIVTVREVVKWCVLMREKGGLTVLPVLDGTSPPAKAETKAKRATRAATAREAVLAAGLDADPTSGCIDSAMIDAMFTALTRAGFKPRVALKEADAELARMGRSGEADIVITPDSDLIALGAQPPGYSTQVAVF